MLRLPLRSVSEQCETKSATFDILLELPDPSTRALHSLLRSLSSSSSSAPLAALDEQSAALVSTIRGLSYQHSLLARFAANPVIFMKEWMESQSLDLQDLLSDESGSLRSASGAWKGREVRDSEWFRKEWVGDAVGMYLARQQQAAYKQ